jgi:hypothetical protein
MHSPRKETTMRTACLAALIGVALAAGCGGGDDEESNADRFEGDEAEVAAVIDDFSEAGRDGDGDRVCSEIFDTALAKNVEREAKQSCATEVNENLPEGDYDLTANSIEVKGNAATAVVSDQDENKSVLYFTKKGDDWRVFRVTPNS